MAQAQGSRAGPDDIADRIVDAILAGRIAPGQRLGEQSLADLFGVSRTLAREALGRLSARGMVEVRPRRGWYVVEPSRDEAKAAFEARIVIETGMLQGPRSALPAAALKRLKQHVSAERAAIRAGEPGPRSYLLGDFHVCLAECVGNAVLADILRDLTVRTTLIASLFQSDHDAAQSCADHAAIVAALEAGEFAAARRLVRDHIQTVASHLGAPGGASDPLQQLRSALQASAPPQAASARRRRTRLFTDLIPSPRQATRAASRRSQEK